MDKIAEIIELFGVISNNIDINHIQNMIIIRRDMEYTTVFTGTEPLRVVAFNNIEMTAETLITILKRRADRVLNPN